MLSVRRDLAAAGAFFARALTVDVRPIGLTSDRAAAYPRVLDERLPAARHVVERYANNLIGVDHSKLRLRPMRGLRWFASARTVVLVMRSCGTCDAATTNSPPTSPFTLEFVWPSNNSRWLSDS